MKIYQFVTEKLIEQYDFEEMMEMFKKEGTWLEKKRCQVPLKEVDYKQYCEKKYNSYKKKIENNEFIETIHIIDKEISDNKLKYSILDGNHRCAVLKDLGITHIDAIIQVLNKQEPNPIFFVIKE